MNAATLKKTLTQALALALFGLATSAQALVLSISPASQVGMPGDAVAVDIVASGLGTDVIGDFDFDIGYDPGALSFTSYSLGAGLGVPGSCFDFISEAVDCSLGGSGGTVNVAELSYLSSADLDALQGSSLVLATLNFMVDVLPEGAFTTISFDTINALGGGSGQALGATTRSGIIRNPSTQIPLPATAFLMLAGLLAMGSQRRR